MKKFQLYSIILIAILGLIFLYPYIEFFLLFVSVILFWSYLHYWRDKSKYGPYIHFRYDPSSTMMVNWVAVDEKYKKDAQSCWVKVSRVSSFDGSPVKEFRCHKIDKEKDRWYYHILLKSLKPYTKYYYQVGLEDKLVFEGKSYHFTTGATKKANSYRNTPNSKKGAKFIIYGDDQIADFVPVLAQLVNHAQYKESPEFMVHLGDINQNIWNLHENNAFFTTKHKLFKNVPYMPVIGNHDAKPISQYDAFYDIEHSYFFEYGSMLRFIILTGHHSLDPKSDDKFLTLPGEENNGSRKGNQRKVNQYEFLEYHLQQAADDGQFAILCIHRSAFHVQKKYTLSRPSKEIKDYLVPLVNKYNKGLQRNVLWFNGHQHDYCRVVKNKMTYITIGACSNAKTYLTLEDGKEKYYVPQEAEKEYGRQSYCLLILDAENEILRVQVKNVFRNIVEELEFRL